MLRRAFTIVELLVVVAILIILASLIFMGMKSARNQATAAIDANDMRTIAAAVVMYAADHNDLLPTTYSGVGPIYRKSSKSLSTALAPYFGPEDPKDGTYFDEFAAANWQGQNVTGPSLLVMQRVYSGDDVDFDRTRPEPSIRPFGYPSGNGKKAPMTLTGAMAQMTNPVNSLMLTENDYYHPNYANSSPGWKEDLPRQLAHGDYRLGVYWDGHVEKLNNELKRK